MPLYCFNKTSASHAIPVVGKLVPPSPAPPNRGPAVNVTSELRGLSVASYEAINVKVQDSTFDFEWTGTVEYETPGLATSRPANPPGVAVTDVALRDVDGNPTGTFDSPLRIDPVGTTAQPVILQGAGDTYLVSASLDISGTAGDEVSVLYVWDPPALFRRAEILYVDFYVLMFDRLSDERIDMQLRRMTDIAPAEAATDGPLKPLPAESNQVPSQLICHSGALLPETDVQPWLTVPMGYMAQRHRWTNGDRGKPLVLRQRTGEGLELRAVLLTDIPDSIRVAATVAWVEFDTSLSDI